MDQQQAQSLNLRTLFMILDYPFNCIPLKERQIDYESFMKRIRAGQVNARYKPDLSSSLLIEILTKFLPDLSARKVVDFMKTEFVELDEKTKLIRYFVGRPRVFDIILSHCSQMRFDLWGVWKNSRDFNILTACIFTENDKTVAVLLKYGFEYSITESTFRSLCKNFFKLEYGGVRIASRNEEENMKHNPRRRRLHLALILFHLFTRAAELPPRIVRCLTLMWNTIEDPFFSQEELFDMLSPLMVEDFKLRFNKLCTDYEERGELTSGTGPRGLKHLAKCTVRKLLAHNYMLPDGVEGLDIPTELKEYLLLHPWTLEQPKC